MSTNLVKKLIEIRINRQLAQLSLFYLRNDMNLVNTIAYLTYLWMEMVEELQVSLVEERVK